MQARTLEKPKSSSEFINQLDYIKLILEDNRHGDALNKLKSLCDDLQHKCDNDRSKFPAELELPKSLVKTKPKNWLFLNETWVKLLGVKGDTIHLEVTKGMEIVSKFKIIKNA